MDDSSDPAEPPGQVTTVLAEIRTSSPQVRGLCVQYWPFELSLN